MNKKSVFTLLVATGIFTLIVWSQWPNAKPSQNILLVHGPTVAVIPTGAAVSSLPQPPASRADPPTVAQEELPPAPAPVVDAQTNLSTAIPEIINFLKNQDYALMYLKYIPPDPSTDEIDRVSMSELLADAKRDPAAGQAEILPMLSDMQFIQNVPPIISDNGNRATYTLPAGSFEENIVFVNINGSWYREDWRFKKITLKE